MVCLRVSFFSITGVLDPVELSLSNGGVIGVAGSISVTGLEGGGEGREGRGRVLLVSDGVTDEEDGRGGGELGTFRE